MRLIICFILSSLAILFLSRCVTLQKCEQKFGNIKSDTVIQTRVDTFEVTEHIKDTIKTTVKGGFAIIHDSIPCPELINKKFTAKSKSGNVSVDVEIKNNNLTADCKADSLIQLLITKERTIKILKDSVTTITKQNQFVDKRPWYQKFPWYGWLASILLLLIIALSIIKSLLNR